MQTLFCMDIRIRPSILTGRSGLVIMNPGSLVYPRQAGGADYMLLETDG